MSSCLSSATISHSVINSIASCSVCGKTEPRNSVGMLASKQLDMSAKAAIQLRRGISLPQIVHHNRQTRREDSDGDMCSRYPQYLFTNRHQLLPSMFGQNDQHNNAMANNIDLFVRSTETRDLVKKYKNVLLHRKHAHNIQLVRSDVNAQREAKECSRKTDVDKGERLHNTNGLLKHMRNRRVRILGLPRLVRGNGRSGEPNDENCDMSSVSINNTTSCFLGKSKWQPAKSLPRRFNRQQTNNGTVAARKNLAENCSSGDSNEMDALKFPKLSHQTDVVSSNKEAGRFEFVTLLTKLSHNNQEFEYSPSALIQQEFSANNEADNIQLNAKIYTNHKVSSGMREKFFPKNLPWQRNGNFHKSLPKVFQYTKSKLLNEAKTYSKLLKTMLSCDKIDRLLAMTKTIQSSDGYQTKSDTAGDKLHSTQSEKPKYIARPFSGLRFIQCTKDNQMNLKTELQSTESDQVQCQMLAPKNTKLHPLRPDDMCVNSVPIHLRQCRKRCKDTMKVNDKSKCDKVCFTTTQTLNSMLNSQCLLDLLHSNVTLNDDNNAVFNDNRINDELHNNVTPNDITEDQRKLGNQLLPILITQTELVETERQMLDQGKYCS